MAGDPDAPSPSVLMYLFADKGVSPPDTALTAGEEVPCRSAKVQRKPLAAGLFAAAFWSLRQDGMISLEPYVRKKLLVKSERIRAARLADGARRGAPGAVLDNLNPVGGEPKDVRDVIRDWFRQDVSDPSGTVVALTRGEAVELGLFVNVDAERSRMGAMLRGATRLEAVCHKISALEEQADQAIAAWQGFHRDEAELAERLVHLSKRAIGSREEGDSGGGTD